MTPCSLHCAPSSSCGCIVDLLPLLLIGKKVAAAKLRLVLASCESMLRAKISIAVGMLCRGGHLGKFVAAGVVAINTATPLIFLLR